MGTPPIPVEEEERAAAEIIVSLATEPIPVAVPIAKRARPAVAEAQQQADE